MCAYSTPHVEDDSIYVCRLVPYLSQQALLIAVPYAWRRAILMLNLYDRLHAAKRCAGFGSSPRMFKIGSAQSPARRSSSNADAHADLHSWESHPSVPDVPELPSLESLQHQHNIGRSPDLSRHSASSPVPAARRPAAGPQLLPGTQCETPAEHVSRVLRNLLTSASLPTCDPRTPSEGSLVSQIMSQAFLPRRRQLCPLCWPAHSAMTQH